MKKILLIGFAALFMASCNMDFYSSDAMTSSQLADNPASAVYTTDGVYSLFKDFLAYKGESADYPNGRNQYLRHYYQITELRSDNVTVSGTTSDPFIHPYDFQDVPTEENIYYTWWLAYKVIYGANSNIDAITPGASAESDHLLGENYVLRALGHFQLVNLFAMPYVYWKEHQDALGIVEHRGMDTYSGEVKRETVGKIYDGIVEDLIEAQKYLGGEGTRSDRGYISMDAAKALLARVYLYMEENQKCLDICNDLMGHAPSAVTSGYDYAGFPTKTYDFDETIWCVRASSIDKFYTTHPTSSIASMYYSDSDLKRFDGDKGWGEHYWSEELIDLFQRYPQDKRFEAYFVQPGATNDGKVMVTFPIKTKTGNTYCSSAIIHGLTQNGDGSVDFTYSGKTFKAEPTVVNGYTQYIVNDAGFVSGKESASVQKRVYVRPDGSVRSNGGNYPIYFNTKFSGQEGKSNLTSPAILRWGELVLNRAEAKAKLNDEQGALDDVNIIRHRAGLTGDADMTLANYKSRGYASVLDVVLDERRMELCFEGLRYFDLIRNRRDIDRRYVGFHEFGIIKWTDPRIALLIPLDEINASHIPQNRQ
ncbi:MAG: RagB/SusD family nutrient uptake outer membrane protein [Bacteroidales bacterium]|nr:RagB/SusD family nutrient uptake outer membrane protein [Bacteroidales bacterium]